MKRSGHNFFFLFVFWKIIGTLERKCCNSFPLCFSPPWGWIWIKNLTLVPGTCALELGPIWRKLELAGEEFLSWVSRIQPDHLQRTSLKIAFCCREYQPQHKDVGPEPTDREAEDFVCFYYLSCGFLNVHPEERKCLPVAAAIRCSHWGTS